MKELRSKKEIYIIAVIAVILILLFFIPINIPSHIESLGKIYPLEQIIIERGADGRIMSTHLNNLSGFVQKYSTLQFQRGDYAEFKLNEEMVSQGSVSVNDTVAKIFSNTTELRLEKLKGDLLIQQANLKLNQSAEKESIIEEAKKKLDYAKRQLLEQQRIFNRDEQQFKKELISQEDYEISRGAVELNKINVKIAEEQLGIVSSGSKDEVVNLIKAKIAALKSEISVLQQKFDNYSIVSPFNGVIEKSLSQDTLIILSDTCKYVTLAAIASEDIDKIAIGDSAQVIIEDIDFVFDGVIEKIDTQLRFSAGKSFYLAYIVSENFNIPYLVNIPVELKIYGTNLSIKDFILQKLR